MFTLRNLLGYWQSIATDPIDGEGPPDPEAMREALAKLATSLSYYGSIVPDTEIASPESD